MKRQTIIIEWVDASIAANDDTYSHDEACKESLIHGFAYGILVNETKTHYTIARDWFDEPNAYRGISTYPKSGIVKVQKFDVFSEDK